MKLTKANGRYEFLCKKEKRHVAKDAGFRFSADGGRPVWWTNSARRALAVAAYADDALRIELAEKAKDEPDPLKITLRLEDTVWRYYSPDAASNGPAKNAQMRFKPDPIPHWWTESRDVAAKCFGQASALPDFVCSKEDQEILVDQIKSIVTAVEMSRATDAEIDLSGFGNGRDLIPLPCQRAAVAWGVKFRRTIIGDPPGAGKTIEGAGLLWATQGWPAVIICPATMKPHWKTHLIDWCHVKARDIFIAEGRKKDTAARYAQALIINYDILPEWLTVVDEMRPLAFLIDESHLIKNEKTQRAVAVKMALKDHRHAAAYLLSGTPLKNRHKELLPQLDMLDALPKIGGSWHFLRRYCGAKQMIIMRWNKKTKMKERLKIWDFSKSTHGEELQNKLRSSGLMLRRSMEDIQPDLPPKRRQVIELPSLKFAAQLRAEQPYMSTTSLSDALIAAVEIAKASDDPGDYMRAVAALAEGEKTSFEETSRVRHETALASLPMIVEHVTNLLDQVPKVMVGAHHRDMIESIAAAFGKAARVLYGKVPSEKRVDIAKEFNENPNATVLITQIEMSVGFSVKASIAVAAELEWDPGTMTQWEDRERGIGRGIKGVPQLVQHLVVQGSVGAQMARTLVVKQEILNKALDAPTSINEWQNEAGETAAEPEDFIPELPEKLEASEPDDMRIAFDLPATSRMTVAQVKQEAETISPDHIALVYKGLRQLAGMCDGAASLDGSGFSRYDVALGHLLASRPALTAAQACLGRKLLGRYKNTQLKGVCDEVWQNNSQQKK